MVEPEQTRNVAPGGATGAVAVPATAAGRAPRLDPRVQVLISQLGSLLGLILVVGFFWATAPPFRSLTNLSNITQQAAVISIVAAGQTFVILTGGIDLSVGAVVGLSSSLA